MNQTIVVDYSQLDEVMIEQLNEYLNHLPEEGVDLEHLYSLIPESSVTVYTYETPEVNETPTLFEQTIEEIINLNQELLEEARGMTPEQLHRNQPNVHIQMTVIDNLFRILSALDNGKSI